MFKLRKTGFTLVETVIAVGMATAIIILVLKLTSVIRGDVAKGTVDLQNLQDARLIINLLRRDFSSATPLYDTDENIDIRDEVRNDPVRYTLMYNAHQSRPIILNEHDIVFCKTTVDKEGNKKREEIQYSFDKVNKVLNRYSSSGVRSLKGLENIKFDLYFHQLNGDVPMILVNMLIRTKSGNETKDLELTTITSSIISNDMANLDWNWSGEN